MAIERLAVVAIIAAALAGCSHSYSGSSTTGANGAPPNSVTTNEGAPAGPGAPPTYQPSHVTGTNTPGESGVGGTSSSTSGGSGSGTSGSGSQ